MDSFQEEGSNALSTDRDADVCTHTTSVDQEGDPASVNPFSSRASLLNTNVQDLISTINDKRRRDSSLLTEFKKDLELQCSALYSRMEATIYGVYEETNKSVEGKLQELLEVLGRISQLESELAEFKDAFSALYSELHGSQDM